MNEVANRKFLKIKKAVVRTSSVIDKAMQRCKMAASLMDGNSFCSKPDTLSHANHILELIHRTDRFIASLHDIIISIGHRLSIWLPMDRSLVTQHVKSQDVLVSSKSLSQYYCIFIHFWKICNVFLLVLVDNAGFSMAVSTFIYTFHNPSSRTKPRKISWENWSKKTWF